MSVPGFLPYHQKKNNSERPIAPLVRWWEWPRAPTLVDWKTRSDVTWDACSKLCNAAKRVGWESLSEMESLDRKEGQLSNGAVTLVVEFGHGCCKSAAECRRSVGVGLCFLHEE